MLQTHSRTSCPMPCFGKLIRKCIIVLIILCIKLPRFTAVEMLNKEHLKGHLQAFGESGSRREIEVRHEFPEPYEFMSQYGKALKPLKLSGVAKTSRAFREWTDDYLLALDVPEDSVVQLETRKNNRNQATATTEVHFHNFLSIYNNSEYYMIDIVPPYLSPDVTVPCSLQCPGLLEKGLSFAVMWFSSGDTKSVIHTDSFGNINCLLRGEKTFVMIDPARDSKKIKLGRKGAFSDIDVDSVDLTQYPDLADVEFYHVHMEAGDCLYIPYLWIHQVRSFNSNIAVNFWWNHYTSVDLLEKNPGSIYQGHCDPDLTLDKIKITLEDQTFDDYKSIRDWFKSYVVNDPFTVGDVLKEVAQEYDGADLTKPIERLITEIFNKLDIDGDGEFTNEEHKNTPKMTWKEVHRDFADLSAMLDVDDEEERREYAAFVEADRRDEL